MKSATSPDPWEYGEVREHEGRKYDERSAHHNGLVGAGALLKRLIKEGNEDEKNDGLCNSK